MSDELGEGRLVDRRINDLDSFGEHTTGPRALAGLYAFLKLDVLVEAAHKISLDFFARPEIYRHESVANVAPELATLHARYGYHESYLSCEQRRVIFKSLFGDEVITTSATRTGGPIPAVRPAPSTNNWGGLADSQIFGPNGATVASDSSPIEETGLPVSAEPESPYVGTSGPAGSPGTPTSPYHSGQDRFGRERDQLLAATAAFAERVFNTGERPLRDTVGVMAPGLKSYLSDMNHAMVQFCRETALRILTEDTSYKILRNPGIAAVFGLEAPSIAWPYVEEPNGTTLVAVITNKQEFHFPDPVSRDAFIDRQRVALRGAEAIATLLDFPDGSDVDGADTNLLISKCYTWYAARGRALGLPLTTVAVVSDTEASFTASDANRRLFSPLSIQ